MRRSFSPFMIGVIALILSVSCSFSASSGGSGGSSTGVKLNKHELNLFVGDTETLTATVTPASSSVYLSWAYEDYSVASVGYSNGIVTARGVGETEISVSTYINGTEYSDTCTVIVSAVPPIEYTAFGKYVIGEITSTRSEVWYHASVTPGKKYKVYLNDGSDGDGEYALDARIYVYHGDKSTYYYFGYYSSLTDAYTNPGQLTVPAGESDLYLKVSPYSYGDTGKFEVGLREIPDSGTVEVTVE